MKAFSKDEAADYKTLKAAILDRYEVTPETSSQKFRSLTWGPPIRPRAMAGVLKDAALRWLLPKTDDGRAVVDRVILEQLLVVMPPRTRHWVACSKLANLKVKVDLWENFMAAELTDRREGNQAGGSQGSQPGESPFQNRGPGEDRPGRARVGGPGPGGSGFRPCIPFLPPTLLKNPTNQQKGPDSSVRQRAGMTEHGPCFQCGQWGHFKKDCPLMECELGTNWFLHVSTRPGQPRPLLQEVHWQGKI